MNRELCRLTLAGIKGKRKNSLFIFCVILLSFTFGIISLSVTASLNRTNKEYRLDTYGSWQGAIKESMDSDKTTLEENTEIEFLGCTECYGTICAQGSVSAIGTVDETFVEIGRIQLQSGRLPQTDQEIAMEADLLSHLGYDYTLGQEITLNVNWKNENVMENLEEITVERTFLLTGVVKEYTDIWSFSHENTGIVLSEALITEEAGKSLMEEAEQISKEKKVEISAPGKSFFFTLKNKNMEKQILKKIGLQGMSRKISENLAAYGTNQEADYQEWYSTLIFIVTILAVFCIYFIYIQKQVRQIALFRSIGITKRQLLLMLFYETIFLCIPGMVLGGIVGYFGTKGLLTLLMESNFAKICVEIPVKELFFMIILWMSGIFLSRTFACVIALKEPLTGRIHMANRKAQFLKRVRTGMILTLMILFCGVVIFTTLESLYPLQQMKEWGDESAYLLHSEVPNVLSKKRPRMLTREDMEELSMIPGIDSCNMYAELGAELSFEGMSAVPLVNKMIELGEKTVNEGMIQTRLLAIPEECWGAYFSAEEVGIDLGKFREGEQVILSFQVSLNGDIRYQHELFQESGLYAADRIQIAVNGRKMSGKEYGEERILFKKESVIGAIITYEDENNFIGNAFLYEPYTIICSENYLKNLLDDLPSGYLCGFYVTGEPFGFTDAHIFANPNAGYLSTDYALAGKCTEKGILFSNNRERYAAEVQKQIQTLLLLWSSGGCIGIILLLILADVLSLEARDERRSYGIMQALGMSGRQMRRQFTRKALNSGVTATVLGFIGYVLTIFLRTRNGTSFSGQMYRTRLGGLNGWLIFILFFVCFGTVSLLFLSVKRTLWREDLMKKLREER